MSGGGISSSIGGGQPQQQQQPQMNWQTGQPMAQPAMPANPTGWNTPTFTTDPTRVSPTQKWWLGNEGNAATALENQKALAALPEDQRAGYVPMTNQQALDNALRQGIKDNMGNYKGMMTNYNTIGVSQDDIQRAIGQGNDVYTYMNRPNYQQYSPNGQFNPTIYQSNYQNYNTGNPMSVSQYGQGQNPYAAGLMLANTPFNPYANSYQTTPFSVPQSQQYYPQVPLANYGSSQPIVSRSAAMRGTPNVVSRAEGGITSLLGN